MSHKNLKKKVFVLLSTLALCGSVSAQEVDSWRGEDKIYHFLGGWGIANMVTVQTESKMYGFLAGTAAGVIKEVLDSTTHKASGKDLVVTTVGAALGAYTGGWFLSRQRDTTIISYSTKF